MKKKRIEPGNTSELRKLAKRKLKAESPQLEKLSFQDPEKIIQELQVQRIELEMQNEELRSSQLKLEETNSKYFDLYNFAPIGYITVDGKGIITEANLTAAKMFSVDKNRFVKKPLTHFIHKDDQDLYYLHNKALLKTKEQQYEILRMKKPGREVFWAEINSVIAQQNNGDSLINMSITDINDHKEAEQTLLRWNKDLEKRVKERTGKLEAAKNQLLRLLDSSPVIIYSSKAEGDYGATFISDNIKQQLGYEPKDFLEDSKFWINHIHPDDLSKVLNNLPEIFKNNYHTHEYRFLAKDGKYRWMQDRLHLIWNKNGNPSEIIGSWIDITERKVDEEKLKESEERFRSLYNNSTIGLYRTTPDGRILLANPTLLKMLGYNSFEELAERNLEKSGYLDQNRRVEFMKILEEQDEITNYETDWLCKDGSIIYIKESARVIRDELGNITFYDGTIQNITERKLVEKQLREKDILLSESQRIARIGGWSWDMSGQINWTEETYSIYGVSPDNYVPTLESLINLVYPEDRLAMELWITDCSAGKNPKELEFRTLLPDGSIRFLIGRGELRYDKENNQVLMTGTVQDISERKQIEEEIKEYAEQYNVIKSTKLFGFWIVNTAGIITDVNDQYCFLSGYSKEELLNSPVSDLEVIEKPEDIARRIERLKERGIDHFETKHKAKDGHIFEAEISVAFWALKRSFIVFIRDITDRKVAEKALKQSEIKYRTVADYTYAWEYWIDGDNNIQYMSPSVERITGYKPEEFIRDNKLLEKIIHDEDKGIWWRHNQESDSSEAPDTHEKVKFRVITKTGEVCWIQHTCRRLYDDEGSFIGFRSSNRDISESKKALELITKLSVAVEQNPLGIIITDNIGSIEYVNGKIREVSGYDAEELIGQKTQVFKSGQTKISTYKELWETILSGNVWRGELLNKRKNGVLFWESLIISPVFNTTGEITNFIAIKEDITERKRIDEELKDYRERLEDLVEESTLELRSSEEKFRALSESSEDTIMRINSNFQYLYANPAVEKLTGIPVSNFIGKTNSELGFSTDLVKLWEHSLEKTFNSKITNRMEYPLPGGIWIDCILIPEFDEEGNVNTVITSGRNITNIKELEIQINKALEKEKELNEIKTRFVSTVSHEFRTPLTSILSSSGFLEMLDEKNYEAKKTKHLERIHKNVRDLTDLLDEILLINKIDSGKHKSEIEKINLPGFCEQLFNDIKESYPEIKSKAKISLKESIYALDKKLLGKVLNNIITNAFKYNVQNGDVNFTVSVKKQELIFKVKDTGIGIPLKEQDHLFQPFHRSSNVSAISGTGLGLSITKKAVEQLGGDISFTSKENYGTEFTVTIPISGEGS